MKTIGTILRELRGTKGLLLREVGAKLSLDPTILSKIERDERMPTKEQVKALADFYKDKKNDVIIAWLSDKLAYEVQDEDLALEALQVAEEKVEYKKFLKMDRKKMLSRLKKGIKQFPKIQRVWIYGSFSRGDDGPRSDIDIAIKTEEGFSYFDLAEIQYQLEKSVQRKVDIGFIDSFKPYIYENLKDDLKLIYER